MTEYKKKQLEIRRIRAEYEARCARRQEMMARIVKVAAVVIGFAVAVGAAVAIHVFAEGGAR